MRQKPAVQVAQPPGGVVWRGGAPPTATWPGRSWPC